MMLNICMLAAKRAGCFFSLFLNSFDKRLWPYKNAEISFQRNSEKGNIRQLIWSKVHSGKFQSHKQCFKCLGLGKATLSQRRTPVLSREQSATTHTLQKHRHRDAAVHTASTSRDSCLYQISAKTPLKHTKAPSLNDEAIKLKRTIQYKVPGPNCWSCLWY